MDGSPLLQGPVQGPTNGPPHFKPYNGHFPRGGNFHLRNTNNRHYRNGNGRFNSRGGYRGGFSKPHQPSTNYENMRPDGGYLPSPPVSMNGMPIYSDNQPAFFPFTPPGPPNPPGYNSYGPPPLVFTGPPGYMGPPPPPEAFGPLPVSNAPFVVGGMPAWSHPPPNFYPGQYFYENGYISPQLGMNGPNGYFGPVGPMAHSEPWAAQPTFTPSPPNINNHAFGHREAPTPAPVKPKPLSTKPNDILTEKIQDAQSLEVDIVGGVPYPKTPEKAPRLIRVYHNDDVNEDLKNGSDKASTVNGIVMSVEEVADNESAMEADSRSRSRSRSLSRSPRGSQSQSPSRSRSNSYSGSRSRSVSVSGIRTSAETDSAPPSDSDKSKKTTEKNKRKKTVHWRNDTPMDKPRSPRNSTTSTASSRTCASPPPKAMDTVVLKTGISLEEYVRTVADGQDLSEEFLQDVIQSLNEEFKGGPKEKQTNKAPQQEKQDLLAAFKKEIKEGLKEEHINEASQQEPPDLLARTNACQPVTGTDSCTSQTGSAVHKSFMKLAQAHPG